MKECDPKNDPCCEEDCQECCTHEYIKGSTCADCEKDMRD